MMPPPSGERAGGSEAELERAGAHGGAVPAESNVAQSRAPTLAEVFASELSTVAHALRRFGVHERDLEDEAHEVFLVVHRRLCDYDPSRPVRAWVLGIAYRRAADYRKLARHARESHLEQIPEAQDAAPGADEQLADLDERRLLLRALDDVDESRRAALVLHDLEGLPMPAVATCLQVPLATAYSRVRRAREELIAAVRRIEGGKKR